MIQNLTLLQFCLEYFGVRAQHVSLLHLDNGEICHHFDLSRLGNRIPFDGQSESDHTQNSLKPEADILQTTVPENEKFYFDMSRAIDRNNNPLDEQMPVKRHSDAVFTDNYSRLRKQMAVKKYLDSVLTGKRSQEDLNPPNLRDEVELLEPAFSENYDDVTVDDMGLLNRLPLVG
ncbi:hypothetical protein Chor_006589 [Crotalus horridus]